jgi:hypothetical protein
MPSYYVIIHLSWDDKFRDTASLLETILCALAQDMRPIEVVDFAEPLTPESMPIKIDISQPLDLTEQNRNDLRSQAYNVARNWLFRYTSHGEIPSALELVHWSRR